MNKRLVIIALLIIFVLMTMACIGSEEITRASASQGAGGSATATSAAQEFHVQLTLTAAEAGAESP